MNDELLDSTVLLSDGTVGSLRGLPAVGDVVEVFLFDHNGSVLKTTGAVAEVLESDLWTH